ncbi:hypothetical protein B0A48_13734 [Cryoendolithus antarcticus]|uniref:Uncharacterized protein n=1 Tax=Cryoendolithus antarcticus TaxID=1507870 RepID=A0A1V8SMJ0_9PEZI|nr:hypothetical protein B0A48_13734 [Cryoendolithus antarcticus]
MDHFTSLPSELVTSIVDLAITAGDAITERKANARALRLVSRKISQCSRDTMLTTYFRHIRLLYTYPALQSLIELTHCSDVRAKIESITFVLVSPKWRECPPSTAYDQAIACSAQPAPATVWKWVYSESRAQAQSTREFEGAMLAALDHTLRHLQSSGNHVNLRILCCKIDPSPDGQQDGTRAEYFLSAYIGGRRLRKLRQYYRDNEMYFSGDVTRLPSSTNAISLLLCALGRTSYSPASLDLDFSDFGVYVPYLEEAFVLPAGMKYPMMQELTTLKLYLDHAEFYEIGYNDFRHGKGVAEIGKWLAVMPGLVYLSLRFYQDPDEYEVDLSEEYLGNVTALVDGLCHTRLRTLVLNEFRVTAAALMQLFRSQVSSLQRLALVQCKLEGSVASGWPGLFAWMANHVTLQEMLFFGSREVPTRPGPTDEQLEDASDDDDPAYDAATVSPSSWWRTGIEAVKSALEEAGHGTLPQCDCVFDNASECCHRPRRIEFDLADYTSFDPIAMTE